MRPHLAPYTYYGAHTHVRVLHDSCNHATSPCHTCALEKCLYQSSIYAMYCFIHTFMLYIVSFIRLEPVFGSCPNKLPLLTWVDPYF